MSESSGTRRVALSPKEFAALFGKSQTWGYRKIYAGKVKTITEYGRILIPAAEVERILGEAGIYDGLKKKVPKSAGKLDEWRKYLHDRRRGKTEKPVGSGHLQSPGKVRIDALVRLTERKLSR